MTTIVRLLFLFVIIVLIFGNIQFARWLQELTSRDPFSLTSWSLGFFFGTLLLLSYVYARNYIDRKKREKGIYARHTSG